MQTDLDRHITVKRCIIFFFILSAEIVIQILLTAYVLID